MILVKKISLLLTACLLLGILNACGQPAETDETTTTNEVVEKVDLNGYEFRYLFDGTDTDNIVFGYNRDATFGDLALSRKAEVEQNLNCKIELCYSTDLATTIKNSIASQTDIYSASQWANYSFQLQNLIRADMMLPISEIDSIINFRDNTDKWGNKYQLESFLWNNDIYGLLPIQWPEYIYFSLDHLFVVNETLIKNGGFTDPREFVEKGEWNRTKLREIMEDYTLTTSAGNEQYGLVCNRFHFFDITLRASEIELVKKENGAWVSGIDTPECIDALNWAEDMIYGTGKDYVYPQIVDTYQAEKAFLEENAVMLLIHSYFIFQPKSQIAYGMEDFGLLPFPLSDSNKSNNWIGQHETLMYGVSIPANVEEPDSTAYILNALYEPLEGYETEEKRLEYYNRNIFHDTRDADVFFKTLQINRYTYRYGNTGFLPTSIAQGLSDQKGKKTVIEYLDSIKAQFESTFDVIIPMYESMEAVWGMEE